MYGKRRKQVELSPTRHEIAAEKRDEGQNKRQTVAAQEPSVFDFVDEIEDRPRIPRSPRRRVFNKVDIPKVRALEADDYLAEAPKDMRPRWSSKSAVKTEKPRPVPVKKAEILRPLEVQPVREKPSVETAGSEILSDLFDGLDSSPTRSTLDIKNLRSSDSIETPVDETVLEFEIVPHIEVHTKEEPQVTTPSKSPSSSRNYGSFRSFRAGEDLNEETDQQANESVSSNLQPSIDLQMAGNNSKFDQEIQFIIEIVGSSKSSLSSKRNALLELATKTITHPKFSDRLRSLDTSKLIEGVIQEGYDMIMVCAWVFLRLDAPAEPVRTIMELLLPNNDNLASTLQQSPKLGKIDRLALDDWTVHLDHHTPNRLALVYLLHQSYEFLIQVCNQTILVHIMESFDPQQIHSIQLVELLVDQVRSYPQFHRVVQIVKNSIIGKSDGLSVHMRLAIILTSDEQNNTFNEDLVVPLLELVRKSGVLKGDIGSEEDQQNSLFALGLLLNLQQHIQWPPSSKPLFKELLDSLQIENDAQNATRVHAIGYFCLLIDTVTETTKKGLEMFNNAVGDNEFLRTKIDTKIKQKC
ncbi:hypothetical protein OGAPHI_004601 [Ogataea philodendri]|uniref:Wings apart-like protein C-terminal domain-containing protein n=1 Tax=Ogataea philodendri TaxID=1378263 RepID=A0A9P8T3J3_9ASCO|nr:uncharacterized protein OGAPHI_004601 [Ogataea philodendri]KAH3664249.1 hypothetical protein OGAPHI_004601 [Ogataea philodendri]